MSDSYRFDLRGFDVVAAALAKAPEVVRDEMSRFFAWVLPHLTSEVRDRTPTAEGHLRNSIIGRSEATANGMLGVVGTALDYAPAVELGTKPHPVSEAGIMALAEWAMRKLPLGQAVSIKTGRPLKNKSAEAMALSAAHAIAWKIRRHGSQGAFMFRDSFAANQAQVAARFARTVEAIVQRIGGSA
jgi:hypothetical protein